MAHELTITSMKLTGPFLPDHSNDDSLSVKTMGLEFAGPVGLAAGLDKNAEAIAFLTHLPFGFIEIGTVTPKPQAGNDRPRLFRYPAEESLRNRMGFNNQGAEAVLEHLKHAKKRNKIIGANLGKIKVTTNEEAPKEYASLYKIFAPHADYLVINVSSPNTPGLRDLLSDKGLRLIFEAVALEREFFRKPLLVKVSPDMDSTQLASVVGLAREFSLDGIIATNTTIMPERGEGGISGRLLTRKARETREILLQEIKATNAQLELIGVGGISDFEDLMDFWKAGGKLAQIYSAFVFKGPAFLYEIEKQLKNEFKKRGVKSFMEFTDALKK